MRNVLVWVSLLAVAYGSLRPLADYCDNNERVRLWDVVKIRDGYDWEGVSCEWTDKYLGWDLHDSITRIANPCLHAPCSDGVASERCYKEWWFIRDEGQIREHEVRCQCPDGSWDSGWLHKPH
jgi:hypothetical protein